MNNKRAAFIVNCAYFAVLAGLAYLFIRFILPPLWPFIIAFVIALICHKPLKLLEEKIHMKKVAMLIVMLLFYALVAGLVVLLASQILSAAVRFFTWLPQLYRNQVEPALYMVSEVIQEKMASISFLKDLDLDSLYRQLVSGLGDFVSKASGSIISWGSGTIASVPMLFARIVLTVVSSVYMLSDYDNIMAFFGRLVPDKSRLILEDVREFATGTILKCLRSYLLIMCFTCAELTLGLTIFGIKNSFLISIAIALCDILPVLGVGTVLIPWGVVCLIIGKTALGVKLLILYLIITAIRNVIEPRIVGAQIDLSPLVALVSVILGTELMGAFGILAGPILIALIKDLNKKGHLDLPFLKNREEKEGA